MPCIPLLMNNEAMVVLGRGHDGGGDRDDNGDGDNNDADADKTVGTYQLF